MTSVRHQQSSPSRPRQVPVDADSFPSASSFIRMVTMMVMMAVMMIGNPVAGAADHYPSASVAFILPHNRASTITRPTSSSSSSSSHLHVSLSPEEQALERTKRHLERLVRNNESVNRVRPGRANGTIDSTGIDDDDGDDGTKVVEVVDADIASMVREYLQYPANALKHDLKARGLPTRGRKPDLALRLAEYDFQQARGVPSSYNDGGGGALGLGEDDDDYPGSRFGSRSSRSSRAGQGGWKGGGTGPAATTTDRLTAAAAAAAASSSAAEATEASSSTEPTVGDVPPRPPAEATTTMTSRPQHAEPHCLATFCGLNLSEAAGAALGRAKFTVPTPIQAEAIPLMARGESVTLHAETGSGKTLAYLLPITEALWKEQRDGIFFDTDNRYSTIARGSRDGGDDDDVTNGDGPTYALILTPTRELAAQVAGVASVLAPPGTVRLVSHPTNLLSDQQYWKERRGSSGTDVETAAQEDYHQGRTSPRIFVGSAKAVMHSLYGDGRMPASPTRKPAAQALLKRTRWVVLDEVDRLLHVQKKARASSSSSSPSGRRGRGGPVHEKPAAIVTSAVARRTLGRVQVVAASATVGRSLKRELSRVLGLSPKEWPQVVRGDGAIERASDSAGDDEDEDEEEDDDDDDDDAEEEGDEEEASSRHVGRAVTIPDTVANYVLPVDTSSTGKLLTSAFFALKALNEGRGGRRKTLFVLTKGCGITTQNAIGALKHFQCQPEPQSLLDVLQSADGTDQLMEVHRRISGSSGVGEAYFRGKDGAIDQGGEDGDGSSSGYLLVTGEDTVRGLHLDGLDTVVIVGRALGPDEYTHIAGRTGRAGRQGKVINILSHQHAAAVRGWEKMLGVDFILLEMDDLASLD